MQGLGKAFLENLIWVFGFITAAFTVIKVLSDYQNRKLAETAIKAKENSVGKTAIDEMRQELEKIEKKIDDVDEHCEERDKQQRQNVSSFFEQTFKLLNSR